MASLTWMGAMVPEGHGAPQGFMDALPDPMKLEWPVVVFVILLVTALYLFLKFTLFKPIARVMDERDAAIAAGSATRAEAAAKTEARQAEYAERLKELRGKAFEHRKALAAAAAQEKERALDEARLKSGEVRRAALEDLKIQGEAAKTQLLAQVDALAESMAQQLLRQA